MIKAFPEWSLEKEKIEEHQKIKIVHEREIWWCSLGINIGDEQDGKNEKFERPVLILKKFSNSLVWVLPMSTKVKEGKYYETLIYKNCEFSVLLSQMRILSTKRLQRFIRKITLDEYNKVVKAFNKITPNERNPE